MLSTNGSGPGNEWRQSCTVGGHGVPDCGVEKEACPLNLAPTASSIAQMAMGDALAVALLDARGFKAEDFARSHPGGALGRRLLTHVRDVMRTGDAVPRVSSQAGLIEVMRVIGHVEGIAFTRFDGRDIVRHPLVQKIVEAYEAYEARAEGVSIAASTPSAT